MVGGRSGRPRRLGKLTPPNCRATAEGAAVWFVLTGRAARRPAWVLQCLAACGSSGSGGAGGDFDQRQLARRQQPVPCACLGRGSAREGLGTWDRVCVSSETASVGRHGLCRRWTGSFFLFLYFFRFIKNIYRDFFFQKCHPAAGSSGGRLLPPDEPVVGSFRGGPWWAEPYRRLKRR